MPLVKHITLFRSFTNLPQLLLVLILGAPLVAAKVSPDEASKLNLDLTPLGAERKGDPDHGIPAWTGGIKVPPVNYQGPGTPPPDPYEVRPVKALNLATSIVTH